MVYVQVTRGVARRDFVFPSEDDGHLADRHRQAHATGTRPRRSPPTGIAVVSLPDNRWDRVDIKSVSLLPNALARQAAKEKGAREAWFVDRDGYVTEGAASNAWIVTREGSLVTRPAEQGILRGVTRTTLLDLARRDGLGGVERPFTLDEAKAAREAFITAATTLIMPVVRIDESAVGDGRPGPVTTRLRREFHSSRRAPFELCATIAFTESFACAGRRPRRLCGHCSRRSSCLS